MSLRCTIGLHKATVWRFDASTLGCEFAIYRQRCARCRLIVAEHWVHASHLVGSAQHADPGLDETYKT